MNPRTTLILLVLVSVLGGLIWVQTGREDPEAMVVDVPLLEGYDPSRLTRVRIDNIERSSHISLERDKAGRWYLSDPIAYPARREMLSQLQQVLRNQARRVSAAELATLDPGLDPPRAVMQVTESLASGEDRVSRIEMGALDIDGISIYVRAGDQVLRTRRNIETILNAHFEDWRSRSVFELDDKGIVEILREGFWYDGPEQTSLFVQAQARGSIWKFDRPGPFLGSAMAVTAWGTGLATLRVSDFRSDIDEPDLERYGLHAPWFSVTLIDRAGRRQTVDVAMKEGAVRAKRRDLPYVWDLDPRELELLRRDPRDLFDRRIASVFRAEVDRILVRGDRSELRFQQDRSASTWSVESMGPDGEWGLALPANPDVVDRLLGTIEQTDVAGILWDETEETYFPADAPARGVWIESNGLRYGGRFGLVRTSPEGVQALTFLREEEGVVSLLPIEVEELMGLTALESQSLMILELREGEISRIGIGMDGGTEREFQREVQGTWVHASEAGLRATELLPALDYLVYLMASEHLAPEQSEALEDVVRVRIAAARELHQVEIGRTSEGEVRAIVGGRQSVLARPELHGILLGIAKKAE